MLTLHVQEAEMRYARHLEAARSGAVDTSDLDACGFMSVPCVDRQGCQVVMFVPDRLPPHITEADAQRVYHSCIMQLDEVAAQRYSVVYVHTGAPQWRHRPNVTQLRSIFEQCAPASPGKVTRVTFWSMRSSAIAM